MDPDENMVRRSDRSGVCRRCGKLMDDSGRVVGHMVFEMAERGKKMCVGCQAEMDGEPDKPLWPDR